MTGPTSGPIPLLHSRSPALAGSRRPTRQRIAAFITIEASDWQTAPTVSGCTPQVHHPPTAPCVDTRYWVTVRVSQTVPQLFSAVLGHPLATVSARATAAVASAEVEGSLILINRQNDAWLEEMGSNLSLGGTPTVKVPNGIILASNVPGTRDAGAGLVDGGGIIDTPFTYVRTGGGIGGNHPEAWIGDIREQGDGKIFNDPMSSRGGQPPLNPHQDTLPLIAVPGGNLNSSVCPGNVCGPGNYFATGKPPGCGSCADIATGDPIRIGSNMSFAGTTAGFSNFGDYVFFGGLRIGSARVNFGPGRYVFAGVKNAGDPVFDNDNRAGLMGTGDAGQVFILTDSSYEGRLTSTLARLPAHPGWTQLGFGKTAIKAGNNGGSFVQLDGLDRENSDVQQAGLREFAPVVIWQDQLNSVVKYATSGGRSTGQIDISCGSIDSPCHNAYSDAPQLEIWATPNTMLSGVVYQPRGAWTVLQASGTYRGPLQIITGAISLQGSGELLLTSLSDPFTLPLVTLVE